MTDFWQCFAAFTLGVIFGWMVLLPIARMVLRPWLDKADF